MRAWDLRVAFLGLAGFLAAISWQVVLPVLPVHLSRIGYTAAQIGVLVSLLSLAMGAVELEVGRIASLIGRRWTLVAGQLLNAAAMGWLGVTHAPAAVGAALASVGAARATMWAPLHASVADAASEETRGHAFSVYMFLTSVGFLAGPAIGGAVATAFGDRAAFDLGAAISLVSVPVVVAATRWERPVPSPAPSHAGVVLSDPAVFRVCLANHLHYAMTAVWSTFVPLYAIGQGLSILTIGEIFAVQGLTYALIQLPTGRMVDRWGPESLLLPAIVGRAALTLLVPLFHAPETFLVAGAVYGLVGGLVPVTFTTLVARLVKQEHYTTAMGVYNSSGDLGFFVGPLLGGGAALLGITAPFFLCVPLGLGAVLTARSLIGVLGAREAA